MNLSNNVPALHIQYDPQACQVEFLHILDEFSERMFSDRAREVLGSEWTRQLRTQDRQVRQRLTSDFRLAIMGDFKRGKSTLINALVGEPVVTTDVTPETVTINHIGYGPQKKAWAVLAGGGRVEMDFGTLKAEKLAAFLQQLPGKLDHLRIEAPVEWLRGVELVDTPGLGDMRWEFDQQVRQFLPQADAIFYVISALSPLSQSEQLFLRGSLLPQDFSRVFFLINMIDHFNSFEESERVIRSVQNKIAPVFPDSPVLGVSALDELCRIQNNERPKPARAAELGQCFANLRTLLKESILTNRDLIRIGRATTQAQDLLAGFDENCRRLRLALEADQARLEDAIRQCQDENSELHQRIQRQKEALRKAIVALGKEAQAWMAEFMERFDRETVSKVTDYPFETLQRFFPFFLTDSLQNALDLCVQTHQAAILESLNAQRTLLADIRGVSQGSPKPGEVDQSIAETAMLETPFTMMDNLHVLEMMSGGMVSVGTVGKILGEIVEQKFEAPNKALYYQSQIRKNLPGLREAIHVEMETLYQQMAQRIEAEVEQAFQQEIERSLAILRQALELQNRGEAHAAAQLEELNSLSQHAALTRQSLDQFQEKLQTSQEIQPV